MTLHRQCIQTMPLLILLKHCIPQNWIFASSLLRLQQTSVL